MSTCFSVPHVGENCKELSVTLTFSATMTSCKQKLKRFFVRDTDIPKPVLAHRREHAPVHLSFQAHLCRHLLQEDTWSFRILKKWWVTRFFLLRLFAALGWWQQVWCRGGVRRIRRKAAAWDLWLKAQSEIRYDAPNQSCSYMCVCREFWKRHSGTRE